MIIAITADIQIIGGAEMNTSARGRAGVEVPRWGSGYRQRQRCSLCMKGGLFYGFTIIKFARLSECTV